VADGYQSPRGSAYPILSAPIVVVFLDIAPLSRGHVLVCPRAHRDKSTEMTVIESAAPGFWLPVLTRALLKATGSMAEDASWSIIHANGMQYQSQIYRRRC
jgi:diadenosine tetraphosphate (Ap4A) HIT family hydrolase